MEASREGDQLARSSDLVCADARLCCVGDQKVGATVSALTAWQAFALGVALGAFLTMAFVFAWSLCAIADRVDRDMGAK